MGRAELVEGDFEKEIEALDKSLDQILLAALKDGAVIVKETEDQELRKVIGKGLKKESRSTGELEQSIRIFESKDKKGKMSVNVKFVEPRKNQTSDAHRTHTRKGRGTQTKRSYSEITNRMIAATIEYGRTGQSPKPFLKATKQKAMPKALIAISDKFDAEVSKL